MSLVFEQALAELSRHDLRGFPQDGSERKWRFEVNAEGWATVEEHLRRLGVPNQLHDMESRLFGYPAVRIADNPELVRLVAREEESR